MSAWAQTDQAHGCCRRDLDAHWRGGSLTEFCQAWRPDVSGTLAATPQPGVASRAPVPLAICLGACCGTKQQHRRCQHRCATWCEIPVRKQRLNCIGTLHSSKDKQHLQYHCCWSRRSWACLWATSHSLKRKRPLGPTPRRSFQCIQPLLSDAQLSGWAASSMCSAGLEVPQTKIPIDAPAARCKDTIGVQLVRYLSQQAGNDVASRCSEVR